MALAIKPLSQVAEKFARVTPTRVQDYADGVNNPRKDWATETAASAPRYVEGINKSIVDKRFEKGVVAAGSDKWAKGATGKGVTRWPQGVAAAGPAYQKGFQPYHDVLSNLTLPERYPAGDERNLARVGTVTKALHAKKIAG